MTKVLFVCMGNICRSPTAEGVFRQLVETVGLGDAIAIDSAGTHDYHVGEPPDWRAQAAAAKRGYDLRGLRGRQVSAQDFQSFDYVLAMDRANLAALERLCPPPQTHKIGLFMGFGRSSAVAEVPDPYYGGADGFERVLDMIEDAGGGLLQEIVRRNAELSA